MPLPNSSRKIISIRSIKLDLQNPRYNDQLARLKKNEWDEDHIQAIISNDLKDIFESIKNHGVMDPIWVVEITPTTFAVIEGSRRVVALRLLSDNSKYKPPKGVRYDRVVANILPSSIHRSDIDALQVLLQTGKKGWGPYNVAFIIDKMFRRKVESKEIAKVMSKTKGFIEREHRTYSLYKEYVEYLKLKKLQPDPRKYTYFQRASDAVRKRFFTTYRNKKEFFELITSHGNNKARISSVALKGGLYHFNKIAEDPQILNKFLNDPDFTVDEAIQLFEGKYVTAKYPWTRKFIDISERIQKMDPDVIQQFKTDRQLKHELKIIHKFCKRVLDD